MRYIVTDSATTDILLSFKMCFGLVSECWILQYIQCFEVDRWIQHNDCTLASVFNEAMFYVEENH